MARARVDRRLAAILAADVVGYSRLMERDEAGTLERLKEHRKAFIEPLIAEHHGRIIKLMGDGALCEFGSVVDAVACAIAIQSGMAEREASIPEDQRIRFRIGINLGDVVSDEGDLYGWQRPTVAAVVALLVIAAGIIGWLRPWQSAGEMIGPTLDTRRVAVLPFANISADAADEYFSDGITEEMITRLSQIQELSVIARTSVIGYKGSSKAVAEVGRELGAGTILEGSVRRAGDQVRITVQLIDARSQAHLWAESYDRQLADVFAVQSDVAQQVAKALRIALLPGVKQRIDRPGTTDPIAHDLYLKARRNYYENTAEGMKQAIAGYAAATQRDSSYAMAFVGLATAWIDAFWLLPVTPREALANAKVAGEQALALDEDLAEAHAALAYAKFYTWDWPGAEAGFKRALELNPNSAWAIDGYNWGYLTQIRGRYDEALVGERAAVELDPLNSSILNNLGFVFYHAGRYDAAIEQFQQSAEMVPDSLWGYFGLGTTYVALRRFDEAVRWFEKAVEVGGSDSMAKAHLGWAYGRAGRTEESRAILDELTSRYPQEKFTPSNFVFVYQGLGDLDNAFLWLERCFEDQDFYLIFLQGREFEDLWGDPRYAAMKARIGFPPRG
jgi:adenylate cyclase